MVETQAQVDELKGIMVRNIGIYHFTSCSAHSAQPWVPEEHPFRRHCQWYCAADALWEAKVYLPSSKVVTWLNNRVFYSWRVFHTTYRSALSLQRNLFALRFHCEWQIGIEEWCCRPVVDVLQIPNAQSPFCIENHVGLSAGSKHFYHSFADGFEES